MLINSKNEILATNLISDIKNEHKSYELLKSIKTQIDNIVDEKNYNLLDHIYHCFDYDDNVLSHDLYDVFVQESLQTLKTDKTTTFLMALPFVFLELKKIKRLVYKKNIRFSNNASEITKKIKSKIYEDVKDLDFQIDIYENFVDYSTFTNDYENIKDLIPAIKNKRSHPFLDKEQSYELNDTNSFDCLKFILLTVTIDHKDKKSINTILKKINDLSFYKEDVEDKIVRSFMIENISLKSSFVGKITPLLSSLKESFSIFNNISNMNAFSYVFLLEPNADNIYTIINIIRSPHDEFINVEFYKKSTNEIIYESDVGKEFNMEECVKNVGIIIKKLGINEILTRRIE